MRVGRSVSGGAPRARTPASNLHSRCRFSGLFQPAPVVADETMDSAGIV